MSKFKPTKRHLREVLLFAFNKNTSAAEARRMIVRTYGEACISEATCRVWFQRYKNGDYTVEDKERPGPVKKFEDAELQALLNEGPCQSQKELADSLGVTQQALSKRLKAMGMTRKKFRSTNRLRSTEFDEDDEKSGIMSSVIPKRPRTDNPPNLT